MCQMDNPDCFNCPYPDCTATLDDIKRQWKHNKVYKKRDSADSVPMEAGVNRVIRITLCNLSELEKVKQTEYNHSPAGKARSKKYEQSDKGKERARRYARSEKGRAAQRRKRQKEYESGKNAEKCRRYRERKKAEKDHAAALQDV